MKIVSKICTKCGRMLPLEMFGKGKQYEDGLRPDCRECRKIETKKRYVEKKEHINKKNKQYRMNNRDRMIKNKKLYYQQNRRKILYQQCKEQHEMGVVFPGFHSWRGMIDFCYDEGCQHYKNVGALGIQVWDSWLGDSGLRGLDGFQRFVDDMGEKPAGHYLSRYDMQDDFTPENCYWKPYKAYLRKLAYERALEDSERRR